MKYLLVLACIGACSFNEKGFDNRTCAADSDCPRPDQSCQEGACVLRSCSAASDCGADFVFDCKDGACVASGCTTDSECGLGYTCENRFCQASFNVSTADSAGNTAMTVTFDAPPDPVSATDLANYSASGLTLSGTPALAGSTVTITTSAQMAKSYTVTVKNVTRAADGVQLRGETAAFTGRPTFNVNSAVSASSRSVLVAFDAAPDMASMTVASYSIDNGLSLTGAPIVLGNTVTLVTSAQSAIPYTVTVTGVKRASDGEPLTVKTAGFMGRGDFSVIGAQAIDSNTVKVSFNNPPEMTQAATLANYTIPGLTLSGVPVLSGNDVFLVTSNQQTQLYSVTISNVTRASDGEALVTSAAEFVGITPFDVNSATAITTSRVAVAFDGTPITAQATNVANYSIPGLTITAATLSGNTVVLTTSLQTATVYNLTVSNVKRVDNEPLSANTASFMGRVPFNITAATSTTSHNVSVTFDAPPDPVQAQTAAFYSIPGLTVSSATLSGQTVTLVTTGQMASSYTVTVSGVTRAADGEPLTTNSAPFTGRTPFDVTSAVATDSHTVVVTFDAPPDMATATTVGNYNVLGLTITAATYPGSGNLVTLTTGSQLAQTYGLTVSNVVRSGDNEPLTVATANFLGRVPFDVTAAVATHTTTIMVTFDAPPNATQARTAGNYNIPGLSVSNAAYPGSGNTVTLTTSQQAAQAYTLTVIGVGRASDGEPLTTSSAMFTGRAPFDVTTAVPITNHIVQLTFDAAPNSVQATSVASYSITPGVTVTSATLSGQTVTLTTSSQSNITFTITVNGVTRASDGETLTLATTTFAGRTSFNVASAASVTSHSMTVTFDAAPDPTAATDATSYTVSGGVSVTAASLSGNTATLSTTAQPAGSLTVTVAGVTRASDGEPLTNASATFTGRTPFDVASAASAGNTSVTVTFDAAPSTTGGTTGANSATNLANYAIIGGSLSLTGTPTISGNKVTIQTSTQVAGAAYTIAASNVVRASDNEPLTNKSASFTGISGFNVISAASVNATTMTVTFDAPPNPGQAVTLANYSVKDSSNNTLTLSGTPTLSGNTVTITTGSQSGTTYTVTVSGVTRAADAVALTINVAQFTHTTFNVASAAAVTNHSMSVTFDAPPDPTTATNIANYSVRCGGSSCMLALSGTPTLSGNTVTFTTASQTAGVTYTVTVSTNVVRAGDLVALTNRTATFQGRAQFNVSSVTPASSVSITVTFSAPPNAAAAQNLANYNIPGLALSGTPVLSGSQVTITTALQANTSYTLTVSNVTRSSDGEPLTTSMATFTGRAQTTATVTNLVVQSTSPSNGTTFYNTGTATVVITGTDFTGTSCPNGVTLNDTDGAGTVIKTHATSCTVDSDTQITAVFPAGIASSYGGWDVLVTNTTGTTNTGSSVNLVVKAGLLVANIYVSSGGSSGYQHEFLELYNPTANAIDVTNVTGTGNVPLSVHVFDGATDATLTLSKISPAPGTYPSIASHGFVLLSSAQSTSDTWYSHADATFNITSSSSPHMVGNGTVYVSLSSTAQSKVLDKAGWGSATGASRVEGSAIGANSSNGQSSQRKPGSGGGAAIDSDTNSNDFNLWSTTLNPLGTKDPPQ